MTLAMLAKHTISTIFAVFLINVGIAHFTDTQWFEPIVPDALGDPTLWVLLTGVLEIILGNRHDYSPDSQVCLYFCWLHF